MKKNKYANSITVDAQIDLHGMTDYEAEDATLDFIQKSLQSKYSTIKIITGKGLQSRNQPVIKNIVREILIQKNLSFQPANVNNGGTGAFIVKTS